jgi:hypothetical protein
VFDLISSLESFFLDDIISLVVISIPGEQNPHWKALCFKKLIFTFSITSSSKPSTVVIEEPFACEARIRHDLTALPSISIAVHQ